MRVAAYARYSSDQQRDASLEDQLRNCRAFAARQGWGEPEAFTDAAISGARNDRPGYAALIAAADRFDVILVDDLARLSRDSLESERMRRRLKFQGVRLISVSEGIDTARKDSKVGAGLRGLMSELYLDDLTEKTHRGLTGRALAGASAGGLPYGYTAPATGQRAVHPDQAVVVRRIFAEFLAGQSPRAIAHALNREGVPSPAGNQWRAGTILGDVKRGIGILANPIYAGRQVWNRSRWVKHPETGRRVRQERPEAEWITTDQPELAIVDAATWAAVHARLRGREHTPGRAPRHLLSGLLRCAECGGAFGVVDAYAYGCAARKNLGTCSSGIRVPIKAGEAALLASVRERLLSEEAWEEVRRGITAALKRRAPNAEAAKRALAQAELKRQNLVAAIEAGIRTPSTLNALQAAEAAVASAQAELRTQAQASPAAMLPRARELWKGLVDTLADASRRKAQARDALRTLIGEAVVRRTENGALVAEIAPSQITMVAGARFGLYLAEPWRITLAEPRTIRTEEPEGNRQGSRTLRRPALKLAP